HDVIAVVDRRAYPAAIRAHQVNVLPGNCRATAPLRRRVVGPAGIPGIGNRVIFPGLALLDKAGIEAADDVDLAVATVISDIRPDAGGRQGSPGGPGVSADVIALGVVQDLGVIIAAE